MPDRICEDDELRYDEFASTGDNGDVEGELRGMTLGQEGDDEPEWGRVAGGAAEQITTPGGTKKKKGIIRGIGKGIKTLWQSASFGGSSIDPVRSPSPIVAFAGRRWGMKGARFGSLLLQLPDALAWVGAAM